MLLACKGHIEATHSKQLIVGCGRLRSVLFMIFSIRSIFFLLLEASKVVEILPDSGGTTSYFYTMGEIM
jgi:hypothetical protein